MPSGTQKLQTEILLLRETQRCNIQFLPSSENKVKQVFLVTVFPEQNIIYC